jgi:hypothetical protein
MIARIFVALLLLAALVVAGIRLFPRPGVSPPVEPLPSAAENAGVNDTQGETPPLTPRKTDRRPNRIPPSAQDHHPTPNPTPAEFVGSVALQLRDGKLSARFRDWTLGTLCVELSRLTGMEITSSPDLTDTLVSDAFQELPLEQGLQRLFGTFDTFYFAQGSTSGAKLKSVWLYPRGRGRAMQPVPPELWASTRDLEAQLTAEDPHERARAVDTLVERDRGPQTVDRVSQALTDADSEVRLRALDAILNFELAVPSEAIATLTDDNDPEIRVRALEVLRFLHAKTAQDASALMPLLEGALRDPDESVRQSARALLKDLQQDQPRASDQSD